jgi:hypothetical protein
MSEEDTVGITIEEMEEGKNQEITIKTTPTNELHIEDNISTMSTEGLNNDYIIDNLSPIWGIMLTVQDNLNLRIGMQLQKKRFNAGFWNYISTPINFTITLFTALSAGQTGSGSDFLNKTQLFYILLTTFVLSIVNTFFKLKEKADINYNSAKQWEQYAATFEHIYFTPINKNDDVQTRLDEYTSLISKINAEYTEETVEYVNYITEVFFYFFRLCKVYKDYRFLGIRRRYWILDGASSTYFKKNMNKSADVDTGPCFKVYDIDAKIFRKDLNKEDKISQQPNNKYYFF